MLGGGSFRTLVLALVFAQTLRLIPLAAAVVPRVSIPDGTAILIALSPSGANRAPTWNILTWNQQVQTFESRAQGTTQTPETKITQLKLFGGAPSAAALLDEDKQVWLANWDPSLPNSVAKVSLVEKTQKAQSLSESLTGDVLILWENGQLTRLLPSGQQTVVFAAGDFPALGIRTPVRWIQQTGPDAYTALSRDGIYRLKGAWVHGEIEWVVDAIALNALPILDLPTQSYSRIREVEQVVLGENLVYLTGRLANGGQKAPHLYSIDLNRSAVMGEEEIQPGIPLLLLGLARGVEEQELIWLSKGNLRQSAVFLGTRGESPNLLETHLKGTARGEAIVWDWPATIAGAAQRRQRVASNTNLPTLISPPRAQIPSSRTSDFERRLMEDLSQLKVTMRLSEFVRFISGYTPPGTLRSSGPIRQLFSSLTDLELLQIGLYRYHLTYECVDGKERSVIDRARIMKAVQTALDRQLAAKNCSAKLTSSQKK